MISLNTTTTNGAEMSVSMKIAFVSACALFVSAGVLFFVGSGLMVHLVFYKPTHPYAIEIPHDRITGVYGEAVAKDMAIFCAPDLADCIYRGFPHGTRVKSVTQDAPGKYRATVFFGTENLHPGEKLAIGAIAACIATVVVVIIWEVYNIKCRSAVFRCAVLNNPLYGAAYDYGNMWTAFSASDGLRLYSCKKNAPVFPTWHFGKATGNPAKPPINMQGISDAIRLYGTTGVGFVISDDITIEWLNDNRMRIWKDGVPYDSCPTEQAAAPAVAESSN